MPMKKIYGVILLVIGAVDLYYAILKLTSGAGKALAKFNKVEDMAVVLLVSGIGFLALGVLKFLEKR